MLFARPARDYFKKIRLHFPFGGLLFSGGSFAIEGLRLRSERDYTEVFNARLQLSLAGRRQTLG